MSTLQAFRLILSDVLVLGGQRVGTFSPRPLSIEQVVNLLNEHFSFADLCKQRGLNVKKISADGKGLLVVGFDGPRRMPIHSDKHLVDFLANPRNTRLPSVEVQLAAGTAAPGKGPSQGPAQLNGRAPRDKFEELEDDKHKLLRATDILERRLDDLDRRLERSREEAQCKLSAAVREVNASQEKQKKELQLQIDALVDADTRTLHDLDIVRQHGFKVERVDREGREELAKMIEQLGQRVEQQLDDVTAELERQKSVDDGLQQQVTANLEATEAELHKHQDELERLETAKVDCDVWQRAEEEMEERNRREFGEIRQIIADTEARLRQELEETRASLEAAIKKLDEDLRANVARIDEALRKLRDDLEAGFKAASEALEAVRKELNKLIDERVSDLAQQTEERFESITQDIKAKDKAINGRVDELVARTGKTFAELNERLEEMVRVERARLGTIERDLAESTTKIRSDFRTEIERVRSDYEQEAARLDMDLSDLHMKHDVTKQEINFFQSRLADQKDWTQRQLTETATATRAVQVDAQEGLAASTKMLHALRDDAVGFRKKMAEYIGVLQHSSDNHGDALSSLETQRSRMRAELDALIGDHKAYTGDMDGWADDVRVKVERLFRALETPRVEWRIFRAAQRARELRRPLAVKSPPFSLRGLREVQIEFYPDGHNSSPEGLACLRLFMPPKASVRYQCWVGRSTDGAHDFRSGNSLSVDLHIEKWEDQIHEDGSVYVVMEVLRDLNNEDASLSREVRVETI
mmetsp:Transcript_72081/g.167033  ORF Transcript_72081/g.167033 Transcript_72081/m.167033 type:complete len:757 (+) Transcript_72081:64-2334(+)